MSGSQLEQAISALIDLFHKHSGPDDTIEKEALLQLLKDNFPNFLSACVSGLLVPRGDGVPGHPWWRGPGMTEGPSRETLDKSLSFSDSHFLICKRAS